MRKGFLFTLSILLLLGFLVAFSTYYAAKPPALARELTASMKTGRAAFVADDLETDLNALLGIGLDINSGNPNTIVTIDDKLPSDFNRARLTRWEQFIESQYGPFISTAFDLNTQAMADANAELLFNNDTQYVFSPTDINSFQLFVPGGDTNILSLDLNVFVNDDLNNSVPWTLGSGDINVTLRYSDTLTGNSFVSSGQLSSTASNQYILRYSPNSADALTITVGRVAGSDAGLRIQHGLFNYAAMTRVRIKATLATPTKPLTVSANMDLNYSQSDMNLSRKPILARG